MRYLTWRLTWDADHQYGVGPEQTVADNGARLEASSWVDPTVENGTILGYLTGNVDLGLLSAWSVAELSQAEALAFAQALNPEAFLLDDGVIGAPLPDGPSDGGMYRWDEDTLAWVAVEVEAPAE